MEQLPLPRNLFGSVATYKQVAIDAAVQSLRAAFDGLIVPFTVGEGIEHVISYGRTGSTRLKTLPYSRAEWSEVISTLDLAWVLLSARRERDLEAGQSSSLATVLIRFAELVDAKGRILPKPRASVFEFSARQTIYGEQVPQAVQQQLIQWARTTFTQHDGVTGYITLDYVTANAYGSMSPYEASVGLSYQWASLAFREKVRGYYFGNLLSASQLELLGGAKSLRQVPAALFVPLGSGGAYLQLGEDINYPDRERLQALKQFLTPLLPKGYPQAPDYYAGLPAFTL